MKCFNHRKLIVFFFWEALQYMLTLWSWRTLEVVSYVVLVKHNHVCGMCMSQDTKLFERDWAWVSQSLDAVTVNGVGGYCLEDIWSTIWHYCIWMMPIWCEESNISYTVYDEAYYSHYFGWWYVMSRVTLNTEGIKAYYVIIQVKIWSR